MFCWNPVLAGLLKSCSCWLGSFADGLSSCVCYMSLATAVGEVSCELAGLWSGLAIWGESATAVDAGSNTGRLPQLLHS